MSKIYILVPDNDMEGYGKPKAACSSMRRANADKAKLIKAGHGPFEIFALELDKEIPTPKER